MHQKKTDSDRTTFEQKKDQMYQQYEKRIQTQLGSLTEKYSNKITELEKRSKEYEGELKKFREYYAI